ncbi:MAG TPA: Uma2 family endonuclease [Candidatus Polarisedimenticolia bacterium]|nr:Uma2 family endonuclease [Candidatus Polarisedimenticolia bacterium]
MKTPALHQFTVEEYHRLAETGILAPDARVELIEGAIHDMSPIGPFHSGIVNRLIRFFSPQAKGRWIISAQNPVGLDRRSEPQPDLMLLKPAPDDFVSHLPVPDDVLLLIEIADSSLEFDRHKKLPIYARAGIPEIWIVNLQELTVEVYREPHFTGYENKTILRAGDKAAPSAFPDVIIDVAELLRR